MFFKYICKHINLTDFMEEMNFGRQSPHTAQTLFIYIDVKWRHHRFCVGCPGARQLQLVKGKVEDRRYKKINQAILCVRSQCPKLRIKID